jgi:hypothetical protein
MIEQVHNCEHDLKLNMDIIPLQWLIIASGCMALVAITFMAKRIQRPVAIVLAFASLSMIACGAFGIWLHALTRLPITTPTDYGLSQEARRIMIVQSFSGGVAVGSLIALSMLRRIDRWFSPTN